MKREFWSGCLVVSAILILSAQVTRAAVLDDAAFFNAIPHTLVTFEVDGDGNPVNIGEGSTMAMPSNEYASLGFTFIGTVAWVNDSGANFDTAQGIGGSLPNAIPAGVNDVFRIQFSTPVNAFGFWVVDNNGAATRPLFSAIDNLDQIIEQVTFQGGLIDGTVGLASYGFMGISSTTPISAIDITKDAAILDDFRFAVVPEPSAALLAVLGAFGIGANFTARRRRAERD